MPPGQRPAETADQLLLAVAADAGSDAFKELVAKITEAKLETAELKEQQKQLNAKERKSLTKALETLGLLVYPSEANFVLVEFGSAEKASNICKKLVDEHGIYVREVGNYKLPTCLRITVGTTEENKLLLDALKNLVVSS